MEGQGKRLLLAVSLALGVMLIWQLVFPSKSDTPDPARGSGSSVTSAPSLPPPGVGAPVVTPNATSGSGVEAPTPPVAEVAQRGKEQSIDLVFPNKFTARFSSYGGALVSWKLADPRFERDGTKGEFLPTFEDTGAFYVNFWRGSKFVLPLKTEWVGTKVSDTEVRYTLKTPELELEKTFTIVPDAFLVRMAIKVKAVITGDQIAPQQLVVTTYAYQDPKLATGGSSQVAARAWQSSTLRGEDVLHTPVASLKKFPRKEVGLTWTGFEHPYLLAAYAPHKTAGTEQLEKRSRAHDLTPEGLMQTDILFPQANLRSSDPTIARELVAYLGPKNYVNVDRADTAAGFPTGFKHTVDLGWFAFIGRPLLWLLLKFQSVVGNWGIAIILLTVLVKLLTLYWMTKSMRSMKAMAALAPQIKEIQAKHKEDRQRQQAETMALYKQHKVNPIAGCLPILLQMPVWIALYRMLSSAGELYQQPFIPGWIDDLTNTDPFHILPVVLVLTMFVQARLTPQSGDSRQQKFIQYGMPLMFGVMSFFFPSGLTLYIFTNTVLSALHSVYMNKYDKKTRAIMVQMKANQDAAAAKAAAVTTPAKKGAAAKKVIDIASTETDSDSDDDDGEPDKTPGSTSNSSGLARTRPRRKKRRR
ncbi:MAG: membrane protein insertase YidC [Kofleriaceae bacterium]